MEAGKHSALSAATPAETTKNRALVSQSQTVRQSDSATIAGILSERAVELLEARGIDTELAAKMGWRSEPNGTISIPFYRNGVEVNFKNRTFEGEKRFYQKEGGDKCFYNLEAIEMALTSEKPLIVTEGEADTLIALKCGFLAVSVPDGAPKVAIGDKESVKYNYLKDIPRKLKEIILCTDSDEAGINLMNDLALRLGKHRCKWVKYPVGCKDLNDTFLKYGKRGVELTIEKAQPMKVDGKYKMSELPPLNENPAFDVGIKALSENFRLRKADFSVVTGIPSHGKTTLANHVAVNMVKNHGWHITFASFEQPPQTEHKYNLVTLYCGRPAHIVKSESPEQYKQAEDWIDRNFTFIVPNEESDDTFDMQWLKDRMAACVTQDNTDMIIIDPWNEIDHAYNQSETSLTQYVGNAIKDLKRFARFYNVHVQVIAHPAKMKKDKDGVYPVPTAYDISDSAHWYNRPEQVVVVHRQEDKTLVRIAKSRYHRTLGKPADVELEFNDYTGEYR